MTKQYAFASRLAFCFIIFISFLSCVKTDDDTYVPSYFSVQSIGMQTLSTQGSADSYITDMWVNLDGLDRGAYELPSRVPLLASGAKHTLLLSPGIKLNGIASTRVPYLMAKDIEIELDLSKDSVIDLHALTTTYKDDVTFALIEDFEDVNIKLDTTSNNTALWTKSYANMHGEQAVYEGAHSGMAILDTAHNFMQLVTKENYEDLPKQGRPIFVELNFKTDETLVFSVNAYTNGIAETTDLLYLNPTTEWKKIYINLTSTISNETGAKSFKFILSAGYTGDAEGQAQVLIDNYKILYRP